MSPIKCFFPARSKTPANSTNSNNPTSNLVHTNARIGPQIQSLDNKPVVISMSCVPVNFDPSNVTVPGFVDQKSMTIGYFPYDSRIAPLPVFPTQICVFPQNPPPLASLNMNPPYTSPTTNQIVSSQLTINQSEQLINQTQNSTFEDVNIFFNAINKIEFTSTKIKGRMKSGYISMHKIRILFKNGSTENGWIIKRSGFGGRAEKLESHIGLGSGTFKFVQTVIIYTETKKTTICLAYATQEHENGMPNDLAKEIRLMQECKKTDVLKEVLICPFYLTKNGKKHRDKEKMTGLVTKTIGLMPISRSANTLADKGSPLQKQAFIKGIFKTLIELTNHNLIHQDFKSDNVDWIGRSFDNGSMIKLPENESDLTDYGSPGYHSLEQSKYPDKPVNAARKQQQDSFAVSATIYHILTGQLLYNKIISGHFFSIDNKIKYQLLKTETTLSDFEYNFKNIQLKIQALSGTFDSAETDNAFKNLMFDMTGTNLDTNSNFKNGYNCFGEDLKKKLVLFINRH
jgi:hypothetical protein